MSCAILLWWIVAGWTAHLYMFLEDTNLRKTGWGEFFTMLFPAAVAGPLMWIGVWLDPPRGPP